MLGRQITVRREKNVAVPYELCYFLGRRRFFISQENACVVTSVDEVPPFKLVLCRGFATPYERTLTTTDSKPVYLL